MGRAKDLKVPSYQAGVDALEACYTRAVHTSKPNFFLSNAFKFKCKAMATQGDDSQPNCYTVYKKVPSTQAFPIFDFARAHLSHWSLWQLIIASTGAESTW